MIGQPLHNTVAISKEYKLLILIVKQGTFTRVLRKIQKQLSSKTRKHQCSFLPLSFKIKCVVQIFEKIQSFLYETIPYNSRGTQKPLSDYNLIFFLVDHVLRNVAIIMAIFVLV
jgi:hypothetical protein